VVPGPVKRTFSGSEPETVKDKEYPGWERRSIQGNPAGKSLSGRQRGGGLLSSVVDRAMGICRLPERDAGEKNFRRVCWEGPKTVDGIFRVERNEPCKAFGKVC